MNWLKASVLMVVLTAGTGCPEEWRKGGTIDQAVHKDVQEGLDRPCATGDTPEWICDTAGKNCRWECPK